MKYGSESGSVWNISLRVEVCGIWFSESERCVVYGSESGGVWEYGSESGSVWNMSLRVEGCGIWL